MSKTALRIAGISVASALACGLAGSANAQLLTHKDISLAMATTIARATIDACKAQGYNVSVHVLGREGQVVLAVRNENAGLATFENSMKKAYTARAQRRPSGDFGDAIKDNFTAGALHLTNLVPTRGRAVLRGGGLREVRRRVRTGPPGGPPAFRRERVAAAPLG